MSTAVRPGTWRGSGGSDDGGYGVDAGTSGTPAVRGAGRGDVAWSGGGRGESLASALGWFSIGLGAAQVIAPHAIARLIGLEPTDRNARVLRVAGLREIGHGAGILSAPSPKEWVGTRVGGDVIDLGLLGAALLGADRRDRALLATAAVLGVAALDVLTFQTLSDSRRVKAPEDLEGHGLPVRRSITVERPIAEVYGFWRDIENLPRFMEHLESVEDLGDGWSRWTAEAPGGMPVSWEAQTIEDRENELIAWRASERAMVYNEGVVRFRPAPADRGTIVTVEMRWAPPGGRIAAAILTLMQREPGQQLADDLRRFKQVLETGDVVVSDATAVRGIHAGQPPRRELH